MHFACNNFIHSSAADVSNPRDFVHKPGKYDSEAATDLPTTYVVSDTVTMRTIGTDLIDLELFDCILLDAELEPSIASENSFSGKSGCYRYDT